MANSSNGYGPVQQWLHWVTVILVIAAWTSGIVGDAVPKGSARAANLFVHVSAGLLILFALLPRLAWRAADPPPPPEPNEFGKWLGAFADPAARLAHAALYLLLIAVPVCGIILTFARGEALPLFGLGEIPSPWPRDRDFARTVKEVHEIAAHTLVILALLHAAAALLHHFVFHDRTLIRMLPHGRRQQ